MTQPNYAPGEIVDITIKSARVTNSYPVRRDGKPEGRVLVADYTTGEHRGVAVNLAASNVAVERVAPADWPPRPGDVWRSSRTDWAPKGRLWLAGEETDDDGASDAYVPMYGDNGHRTAADELLRIGPMVLVHREAAVGEPA